MEGTETDGKIHSGQLCAGISLILFHSTLCFGCMAQVCDLLPGGTCSVNECKPTDREVEGCNPDNSASRVDCPVFGLD